MVPRARIARRVYTDLACRWPHDRVAPMLTAITLGAFAQAPPSKTQHVKVSVVPRLALMTSTARKRLSEPVSTNAYTAISRVGNPSSVAMIARHNWEYTQPTGPSKSTQGVVQAYPATLSA